MLPSETKNQLKILQKEKQNIISSIKTKHEYDKKNNEKQEEKKIFIKIKDEILNNKRIIEIEKEMTNLNKLDDSEKNIHAIWIGIPPKGEFDNLKAWAKFNPEYKIHIWTDSNHILSHELGSIISNQVWKINNGVEEYDYELEATLKDEFYYNYQLKNPEKTFDENVKNFLTDKMYANEEEIDNWIKEGQQKIIEEQAEIKKYTNNQVILHDVVEEKDNIFLTKKYYDGYLKTLEHLHICAGASDRLRYAILDKFGGVYLDTDLITKFSLKDIENNEIINILINLVEWDDYYNNDSETQKFELIMNQIILLDCLNQLNKEKIKDFAENWKKVLEGDSEKNQKIFQEIAKEFKSMNLDIKPEMKLSDFSINNFFQTSFLIDNKGSFSNAFISSKKNSEFLKEIIEKIEIIDEKIKNMPTHRKLFYKNEMILNHTGPNNITYTTLENDENFYFHYPYEKKFNSNIASLDTINSIDSSWCFSNFPNTTFDLLKMKSFFWTNKNEKEILKYLQHNQENQNLNNEVKNWEKIKELFPNKIKTIKKIEEFFTNEIEHWEKIEKFSKQLKVQSHQIKEKQDRTVEEERDFE